MKYRPDFSKSYVDIYLCRCLGTYLFIYLFVIIFIYIINIEGLS